MADLEITNEALAEALVSSWTMTTATIILLSGQIGFTALELAQTFKKNRDFIVMKNLVVLVITILTWFAVGYAVAFGTNPDATYIQFAGLYHGWVGDFSGGLYLRNDTIAEHLSLKAYVSEPELNQSLIFNQRRFFVFLTFIIISSNITTSCIAERVKMSSIALFVIL